MKPTHNHYHLVGIGGYGMSAIAHILLQMGKKVTGSDLRPSERTDRLEAMGAMIYKSHHPAHVEGADVVVYSTDVPGDNPELVAARERGIEVRHRSEVLADILNERDGIAVSGTHGKTTVTSMISLVLERGGLDPTAVIGADVHFYGTNAKLGSGPYVVAEADESDRSFLRYRPLIAVVTNIEPEHLDHYNSDFSNLVRAFRQFIDQVKEGGLAVLCSDDARVMEIAEDYGHYRIFYGLGPEAELSAHDVVATKTETIYTVSYKNRDLGRAMLVVPGVHNVVNSLAAFAVGLHMGVPFTVMRDALREFRGAKRRFQVIGQPGGITVVDDYAHHPTEIKATLRAARERTPNRVIAVFQPQRYSRTKMLMHEFSDAFSQADEVVLTDIYAPPGEKPIPGVSSQALAELVRERANREVSCFSRKEDIVDYLMGIARPGDVILTMGAGDIWKVAATVVERLEGRIKAS